MIRVTVDLVPFGDESKKKKIGSLVLANIGNKNLPTGDCWYQCIYKDDISGVHYSEMAHTRKDGVWKLLHLLLDPTSEIPAHTEGRILRLLEERL